MRWQNWSKGNCPLRRNQIPVPTMLPRSARKKRHWISSNRPSCWHARFAHSIHFLVPVLSMAKSRSNCGRRRPSMLPPQPRLVQCWLPTHKVACRLPVVAAYCTSQSCKNREVSVCRSLNFLKDFRSLRAHFIRHYLAAAQLRQLLPEQIGTAMDVVIPMLGGIVIGSIGDVLEGPPWHAIAMTGVCDGK